MLKIEEAKIHDNEVQVRINELRKQQEEIQKQIDEIRKEKTGVSKTEIKHDVEFLNKYTKEGGKEWKFKRIKSKFENEYRNYVLLIENENSKTKYKIEWL